MEPRQVLGALHVNVVTKRNFLEEIQHVGQVSKRLKLASGGQAGLQAERWVETVMNHPSVAEQEGSMSRSTTPSLCREVASDGFLGGAMESSSQSAYETRGPVVRDVNFHVTALKLRLSMAMFKLRRNKAEVDYRSVVSSKGLATYVNVGAHALQPNAISNKATTVDMFARFTPQDRPPVQLMSRKNQCVSLPVDIRSECVTSVQKRIQPDSIS